MKTPLALAMSIIVVCRRPVKAWKMKNSGVYDLINFEANLSLPRKGYQCDWPPLIGKIS